MKVLKATSLQAVVIAAAMAAFGPSGAARAQDAPPPVVDTPPPSSTESAPPPPVTTNPATTTAEAPPVTPAQVAPDANVYNWKDVPANQQVVIDRAVFDQGGYQLYCHTGETIVVPFVNNNLYVMKFGRSDGSAMYFINDGAAPTLYVPQGGYLENAAAEGAKWYPFPPNYIYTAPIYIGVAPDWDDYYDMAWYPGMVCYGGYWGYHPYVVGVAAYTPLPGFYFAIYDHPYYGWSSYHSYYAVHPEHRVFFRTTVVYHYDRFPARGAAYYEHSRPFNAGHPLVPGDRALNVNERANPVIPSGTSRPAAAVGTSHFGITTTTTVAKPAPWGTPHFGGGSVALGSATTTHAPFSSHGWLSSGSGSTHAPFGGGSTAPSIPGSSRSYGGDTSPRWGTSSGSTSSNPSSSHGSGSGGGSHSSSGGGSSSSHSSQPSSSNSSNGDKKKP